MVEAEKKLCQGPDSLWLNSGRCCFLPLDGAAVILYILILKCQVSQIKLEVINIFLFKKKSLFYCFKLVQKMSSFISANLYHIKKWFTMTRTVGKCTIIVQMCVKLREGY